MSRLALALSILFSAVTALGERTPLRDAPRETPSGAIRDVAGTTRTPIEVGGSRRLTANNEQYPDPCVTMPDLCEAYDNGGTATGGSGTGGYSYCVAVGSRGEMCRDKVKYYSEGDLCANGCYICASVSYSAYCNCNATTLKTSGTCKYW